MANAATQTKPLHIGNAARRGLEAAQLAGMGLEGNPAILDIERGFGVYYKHYSPSAMAEPGAGAFRWLLEDQDVAVKQIPAHLGMHWVVDAALAARAKFESAVGNFDLNQIRRVILRVPRSKYVNLPSPTTEHQARHSFQFNACSALLDNHMSVASFSRGQLYRPALTELLSKVTMETPEDNEPNFDQMYCEVEIETHQGQSHTARCDTFYGHWRTPLSQEDLEAKFKANASVVLCPEGVEGVLDEVAHMEERERPSLAAYLRLTPGGHEQQYTRTTGAL